MNKKLVTSFPLAAVLLTFCAFPASAQTVRNWIGGSGSGLDWGTAANWTSSTLPVNPTYYAQFTAGTTASINVPNGSTTARITLEGNTDINLVLSGSLYAPGLLRVGNTSAGAGKLTAAGSGTFEVTSFQIGSVASTPGGNALTITGDAVFNVTGSGGNGYVGRFGSNNAFVVSNKKVNLLNGLSLAFDTSGNSTTVTGTGTQITVYDTSSSSNRGLKVAASSSAVNYAAGPAGNSVGILNGASILVTTATNATITSTANNLITVGSVAYAHDNSISISGTGSTLTLGKGDSTSTGTIVTIGDSGSTNSGGNYIEVKNGGSIVSQSGHTGNITIYGYSSSGTNSGANKLSIGSNGTVNIGGNVVVSGGTLLLASTGTLSAANVMVGSGGRFEAVGNGLATTGSTAIASGGVLAVGLDTDGAAETLSLNSGVSLASNAKLELTIYSASAVDQLYLASGGTLTLASGAVLSLALNGYTPTFGNTWTLLAGATFGNITGTFTLDLPTLSGSLQWNTSSFNQAGGWQVSVVPEPSTLALAGAGLLLAGGMMRRKIRG